MSVNGIGENNIWFDKYKEFLKDGKKFRFLTGGRYQGRSEYIKWLKEQEVDKK